MSVTRIKISEAIASYNERNPEKRQLDRNSMVEKTGATYNTLFTNWDKGQVSKAINLLISISDITGVSLDDLIERDTD